MLSINVVQHKIKRAMETLIKQMGWFYRLVQLFQVMLLILGLKDHSTYLLYLTKSKLGVIKKWKGGRGQFNEAQFNQDYEIF